MNNLTNMLLDFTTPFDTLKVRLLDQVVQAMYSNNQRDVSNYLEGSLFCADGKRQPNSEPIQAEFKCVAHRRQNTNAVRKHHVKVPRPLNSRWGCPSKYFSPHISHVTFYRLAGKSWMTRTRTRSAPAWCKWFWSSQKRQPPTSNSC